MRAGAFAGGRVLLSLGGREAGKSRAALTVAPTFIRDSATGYRHSYGSGLEVGFAGRDPHFSACGTKLWGGVTQFERQDRMGLSTLGAAGVVVAGAAIIGGVIFAAQVAEGNRNSD